MRKPKIKYNYIYINLKKWLAENQARLPFIPELKRFHRNGFTMSIPRVKNISVNFNIYGNVEVWAWKPPGKYAEDFDILTEFDLFEDKNEFGYFCGLCNSPEYFKNRYDLWVTHAYVPLFKWLTENITQENYLCIFQTEDRGALWAKILNKEAIENNKEKELMVFCELVIKNPKALNL
jgi:hypothetical protein